MKWLKILGLVAVLIVGAIALLAWWVGPHEPSDKTLEKQFYRQRPNLERLTGMLAEDPQMSRIAPDFLWTQDSVAWPRPESEWGISRVRWEEYKRLFRRAGVQEGANSEGKSKEAVLIVYTWGIVPSGVSVGYLHCGQPDHGSEPTEPACVERKDSGTGMYGNSTSYGYRYKKISGDWFILEQSN
ncbi:MAG: hypothetical protein ACYDCG_16755 [Candidatus Acidiferrales bacterium]